MAVDGVVPEVVDKRPSSSEGLYINCRPAQSQESES